MPGLPQHLIHECFEIFLKLDDIRTPLPLPIEIEALLDEVQLAATHMGKAEMDARAVRH